MLVKLNNTCESHRSWALLTTEKVHDEDVVCCQKKKKTEMSSILHIKAKEEHEYIFRTEIEDFEPINTRNSVKQT
jgi:hypothetical protein